MDLPLIPTAAALLLLTILLYKSLLYPAFLSPLSRIPAAHWTASISPLWILSHRQQRTDTFAVHAAHQRLGPLIRLAPNELSVNLVEHGIRTIYAGGFEKGDWYSNAFTNYGLRPMFAMEEHGAHARRKRMLSNVYAKTTLRASAGLIAATKILIEDRLVPSLRREVRSASSSASASASPSSSAGTKKRLEAGVVDMYDVVSATVTDFVAAYVFGLGNGSDFVRDRRAAGKFFRDFKARQKYTFWPQEMPKFTAFVRSLGVEGLLVPAWVARANREIESWLMAMCDRAEATVVASAAAAAEQQVSSAEAMRPENHPTVYAQLRQALIQDARRSGLLSGLGGGKGKEAEIAEIVAANRLTIASELLDHTLAGFDTSGITLTWLAWEVSKVEHVEWQTRLRAELQAMDGSLDAKLLDEQPVLEAILMETLRLHAAIPGNQPRMTPMDGAVLGDEARGVAVKVPGGVRVQAQAWSLHRNPDVFPDPERWNPARWLDADDGRKREMGRWFWAFGSGGRMCVGSNLAMLDMKATIAGIWGNFATEIVDDEGMIHNGGYIAEPLGVGPGGKKGFGDGRRFLLLRLSELDEKAV